MIDEGKIIVIDDFISLEYQEKIKQDLIGLENDFPWHYTEVLQVLVILIVNIDQQCHINM